MPMDEIRIIDDPRECFEEDDDDTDDDDDDDATEIHIIATSSS
jgi:hypothetical protein